jgi:hypothetical protein
MCCCCVSSWLWDGAQQLGQQLPLGVVDTINGLVSLLEAGAGQCGCCCCPKCVCFATCVARAWQLGLAKTFMLLLAAPAATSVRRLCHMPHTLYIILARVSAS